MFDFSVLKGNVYCHCANHVSGCVAPQIFPVDKWSRDTKAEYTLPYAQIEWEMLAWLKGHSAQRSYDWGALKWPGN